MERYDDENGTTGIRETRAGGWRRRRRRQTCFAPHVRVFCFYYYCYSNLFTLYSTYYSDNDGDTTTGIRETRAGGSRRCRRVSSFKYVFLFLFFTLLIF